VYDDPLLELPQAAILAILLATTSIQPNHQQRYRHKTQ
jgi:hypothetical protein